MSSSPSYPLVTVTDSFQVLRAVYPALSPLQINEWFSTLVQNARTTCQFLKDNAGVVNYAAISGIDGAPVIMSRRDIFRYIVVVRTQAQIQQQLLAEGVPLSDRLTMSQGIEKLFDESFATACNNFSLYQVVLASLGLISDMSTSDLVRVRENTMTIIHSMQILLSSPRKKNEVSVFKWRLATSQVQLRTINQEIESRKKFF